MTKELRHLEEQSKSIAESIGLFNGQSLKPVHAGKAMEQVLSLADTLLKFLDEKSATTFDDAALVSAIKVIENDFLNKKERYQQALQKLSEYGQIIEESKTIEQEHQKILDDIRDAENTVAGKESRAALLYTEYKRLTNKIKNLREAIDDIENTHNKNLENYKKHYEKNDLILKSIPYGQEDPRKALTALSEEIKNKILSFDLGLKDLIKSGSEVPIETINDSVEGSLKLKRKPHEPSAWAD